VADRVFGQGGSFTSRVCNLGGISASSLCGLGGVAVDRAGNLYVADGRSIGGHSIPEAPPRPSPNHRVLEYDSPLTTDTVADHVFGQGGSFTSNTCNLGGISASSLCVPFGVAVDAAGNLYVADQANNRVLEYDSPLPPFHDAKVLKFDTGGRDLALGGDGVKTRDVQLQFQNKSAHTDFIRGTLEIAGLPAGCTAQNLKNGALVSSSGGLLVDDTSRYLPNQAKKFDFKMKITCPTPIAFGPTSITLIARADHNGDDDLSPDNDDSNPSNNVRTRFHVLKQ
jgi:hypothetical protein